MEITYLDRAAFRLKADRVVGINVPHRDLSIDITLFSDRKSSKLQIVDGPGEYEIGGVLITTIAVSSLGGTGLIHSIDMGGISVVHLGTDVPLVDERMVERIGSTDVLLVPTDDQSAAVLAVQTLQPRVVIPFGQNAQETCERLGVRAPHAESRFAWNGTGSVPKAVLLKPQGTKKRAA